MRVGIVVAKKTSRRFPGKNFYRHKDVPLFWHSVQALLDSDMVDVVYVATDSEDIEAYCNERNVLTLWRYPNAAHNNEPLFDVLKWVYRSIGVKASTIVSVMANCPGHSGKDVDAAVKLLESQKLYEVRSFDNEGNENGIIAMSEKLLYERLQISAYIGAVVSGATEIHHIEDLDNA